MGSFSADLVVVFNLLIKEELGCALGKRFLFFMFCFVILGMSYNCSRLGDERERRIFGEICSRRSVT